MGALKLDDEGMGDVAWLSNSKEMLVPIGLKEIEGDANPNR